MTTSAHAREPVQVVRERVALNPAYHNFRETGLLQEDAKAVSGMQNQMFAGENKAPESFELEEGNEEIPRVRNFQKNSHTVGKFGAKDPQRA